MEILQVGHKQPVKLAPKMANVLHIPSATATALQMGSHRQPFKLALEMVLFLHMPSVTIIGRKQPVKPAFQFCSNE